MTPTVNEFKQYLAPGVWMDMDGGVHFAIPEILAHLGLENSPENHRMIREELSKICRAPDTKIIHRYDKDGKPNAEERPE